jgi:hypothetical protein
VINVHLEFIHHDVRDAHMHLGAQSHVAWEYHQHAVSGGASGVFISACGEVMIKLVLWSRSTLQCNLMEITQ